MCWSGPGILFWDSFTRGNDMQAATRGRRRSIPPAAFGDIFAWHGQGFGCRRIVGLLGKQGIRCGKSSVFRLLRGQPPYLELVTND